MAPTAVPDAHAAPGIIVVDNFLDEHTCSLLLKMCPQLGEGMRTSLGELLVPQEIERRMRKILEDRAVGPDLVADSGPPPSMDGPSPPTDMGSASSVGCLKQLVLMPARVARGSSPMHHDNGFDASGNPDPRIVEGYVVVLYLEGRGRLIMDSGGPEHVVGVRPGRLIAWPNGVYLHRLDASAGSATRTMIGPMTLDTAGAWQRAGDQYTVWRMGCAESYPGQFSDMEKKEEKKQEDAEGAEEQQPAGAEGAEEKKEGQNELAQLVDEETEFANKIKAVFASADVNTDGRLSVDEFKRVLAQLDVEQSLTEEELNTLFKQADVDNDGFLKYEEFIDWCYLAQ